MGTTLAEKVWDSHVVRRVAGEPDLLYIDLHLVHEVTSAQAFEALRLAGRKVRRPDLTLLTVDHNVPTRDRDKEWSDPLSVQQVAAISKNAEDFGLPVDEYRDLADELRALGVPIGDDVIPSIRSIEESESE